MNYSIMKKTVLLISAVCLAGCSAMQQTMNPAAEDGAEKEYGCTAVDIYNYSGTVPEHAPAEDWWYDGALYAGDSRMGTLALFGTHPNAEVDYVTSLNLLLIDMMQVDEREDEVTLVDIFSTTDKRDIYLLFGINEIRNPNFYAFADKYQEVIDLIRNQVPYANIYIMLAYHPDYISNLPEPALTEHLDDLNNTLRWVAATKRVFVINTGEALEGEDGTVVDEYVWDGLHVNPAGAAVLEDYLGRHYIWSGEYVKEICE